MATQLNIKSAEARTLAEDLARLTGSSITQAVTDALRARLSVVKYARTTAQQRERDIETGFYDMIVGTREMWKGAALSLDHGDLLYDERGLPR